MGAQQTLVVGIRDWQEDDRALLERLMEDPTAAAQMDDAGPSEPVLVRHERYLRSRGSGKGAMFAIVLGPKKIPVGWVGYWERVWQGQHMWEVGWSMLPEYAGQELEMRAIGRAAARARADGKFRFMHAFPSVADRALNVMYLKAGFSLAGEVEFESAGAHTMRRNDWRLDLFEAVYKD